MSDVLLVTTNFASSHGSILSLASGFFPTYERFPTTYNRFCITRERLRTTLVVYYPVLIKDFSVSEIKQFISVTRAQSYQRAWQFPFCSVTEKKTQPH